MGYSGDVGLRRLDVGKSCWREEMLGGVGDGHGFSFYFVSFQEITVQFEFVLRSLTHIKRLKIVIV